MRDTADRSAKSKPGAFLTKHSPRQAGAEPAQAPVLDEEIRALRDSAQQMLAQAQGIADPLDAIKAFSAFGAQIVRIANLLRLQAALQGVADDETTRAAIEAISCLAKEWKK